MKEIIASLVALGYSQDDLSALTNKALLELYQTEAEDLYDIFTCPQPRAA